MLYMIYVRSWHVSVAPPCASIQWFNWFKSVPFLHTSPGNPLYKAWVCWAVTGEKKQGWTLLTDIQVYSLGFCLRHLDEGSTHVTLMLNCGFSNKQQHVYLWVKWQSNSSLQPTVLNRTGFIEFYGLWKHPPTCSHKHIRQCWTFTHCSDYL